MIWFDYAHCLYSDLEEEEIIEVNCEDKMKTADLSNVTSCLYFWLKSIESNRVFQQGYAEQDTEVWL